MDLLNTDSTESTNKLSASGPTDTLSYSIQTFGCKVNTYDTGLLSKRLEKVGFRSQKDPLIHILNTCAVTGEATQEALRSARRLKRKNPNCVVVVTGCSAQVDTEKFTDVSEVNLVVANSHKGDIENLIRRHLSGQLEQKTFKSNIFKKEDFEAGGGIEEEHTRAYLKIQDGCNSFCTYCVIPFARGKSRSLTIESLRERVNELLASGSREVVLTGVHIGDYEFGLENLIEDLLLHTRVPRLRLTSLEPVELNPRLMELFQDPRMCPHFHMSIQSATTSVLTDMKRNYSAVDVENSLQLIAQKVPHAFVGMDVIVGFPGEGELEFSETYARLNELPWSRIHVFPYSERPGTYAVRLQNKNERHVIARRADRLRELSTARHLVCAKNQIGQLKKALVLQNGTALTRDYWPLRFETPLEKSTTNTEIRTRILAPAEDFHRSGALLAESSNETHE